MPAPLAVFTLGGSKGGGRWGQAGRWVSPDLPRLAPSAQVLNRLPQVPAVCVLHQATHLKACLASFSLSCALWPACAQPRHLTAPLSKISINPDISLCTSPLAPLLQGLGADSCMPAALVSYFGSISMRLLICLALKLVTIPPQTAD